MHYFIFTLHEHYKGYIYIYIYIYMYIYVCIYRSILSDIDNSLISINTYAI